MSPIITQPGAPAHAHDEAARKRRDRLASTTAEQTEAALAFLSAIDPQMFEIAMDAATQIADDAPEEKEPEDHEPMPVCRRCGGQVGIFLRYGLDWQHFHGNGTTSGQQELYDPGHPAEVTWRLPDEGPEEQ